MSTQTTPAERAAEYLERIAGLTGAKLDDEGTYHLTAGRMRFRVDYKFVISHCGKSTCFSVEAYRDIPRAEVIASALLHLKNNPRLSSWLLLPLVQSLDAQFSSDPIRWFCQD
jgi:hypothetical protein